ncbi:tubulin binding cofactor C-domain-containing protein [Mycena rebaudengoi]|nr:tubulin binding cofactor C-domain-containing protein [Mycena rebaudengoi]
MSDPAWLFSQTFLAEFQASRTELESRLESTKAATITSDVLHDLSVDLAKLTKALAEATGSLPSYAQRQYELQLKALEKSLEELRTLMPKSKFTFKRKAPAPSAASSTPAMVPEPSQASVSSSTTNAILESRSFQYLSMASLPAAVHASDITISDLAHCIVNLLPDRLSPGQHNHEISAIHVRDLSDTVLLLPAIHGSVLLHNLRRCIIVVGCHQFRMHTSQAVDVYLSIPSTPIIEHCSRIRFAPYPASLSGDDTPNNIFSVQDFSHIRSTPSPHWSMIASDALIDEWPTNPIAAADVAEVLGELLAGVSA